MLIALCSVKGSPGVTTLAAALAAQWPQTAHPCRLVAEVDPGGGDLAMRFRLASAPGLVSLAAAARRTRDATVVWKHTQPLINGAHALPAPAAGPHARAALHTLATAPGGPLLDAAAGEPGVVVLADCGRIDPGSPAEAIARRADALVLVAGTHADELAHVAARLGELACWTPRPGLLLTGRGYPTGDVERELGVPAIGRIPYDPPAAAALAGHRTPARRRAGGLARSAAALARTLAHPPTATPQSPMGGTAVVPGVPAQQVRHFGGPVIGPPASAPHAHRPAITSPHGGDPRSNPLGNGHQPTSTSGKETPI